MYTVSSVKHIVNSQVGYREGRSDGHWNNRQKYAAQVPGLGWADGQPWCCVFAGWAYTQTGIQVPTGAISASCAASVAAYKKAGRFTEYPVTGAQIFFGAGGGAHTGIVVGWDSTRVFTVEGNTNTTGGAEGDGVYTKTRIRRSDYVYGYGIPYFENDAADTPDPAWKGRPMGR